MYLVGGTVRDLLVGRGNVDDVEASLDELSQLVDTAGAEVGGRISQQITSPSPATPRSEGVLKEAQSSWLLLIFWRPTSMSAAALPCRICQRSR